MYERSPAVAGSFYEADPGRLDRQVAACFAANEPVSEKLPFIGAVVPHAGLVYSGHVAAALYDLLDLPQRLIILCPNHTGLGVPAAINTSGAWRTPLGSMKIDEEIAQALCRESKLFEEDRLAHAREHSLEVQLPFLQRRVPNARFVPICLHLPNFLLCEETGEAIARVVSELRGRGERVAILASSDMNHYESQKITLVKDQKAIDRILELDARGLWDTVRQQDISMCGIIPTTAMLVAANRLGASGARLIKHATSGDVNRDYDAVVGYASMVIT